jgi:hypothetical protein
VREAVVMETAGERLNAWRKALGAMSTVEARIEAFENAADDIGKYVARGLEKPVAADWLRDLATAHGLFDVYNEDDIQAIIGEAIERGDQVERVPDIKYEYSDSGEPLDKSNGHDKNPPLPVLFPFPIDEQTIPTRNWIVPGLLLRKHVTVLVAPSGSGKSLLTLQIGIACAQGVAWSGWIPRGRSRVLVINSEDDTPELQRRLAAASRPDARIGFQVDQQEIRNRIGLIDAGSISAVIAEFDPRKKKLVNTPRFEKVISTIIANEFDLIFVDPFAETFEGDENSNSELKWAGMLWREVARRTNAAVCLIHHTKKYATGMAGDVDAARGAGALIGIARIVSTLFPMTAKEAEAMGVASDQRAFFLRFDDAKANLNMISPFARWFRKETVTLDNANTDLPGDQVGVLIPWKPKGPSVLEAQIVACLVRIDQGILDDDGNPTGEFYTLEKRGKATERYLGFFVQEFFKLEAMSQAESLIETWRKAKRLREGPAYKSPETRKMRARVISEFNELAKAKNPEPLEQAASLF